MLKKLGIIATCAVMALIAVGVLARPPAARANPTGALLISVNACVGLGAVAAGGDAPVVFFGCTQPLSLSTSVFNFDESAKVLNIDVIAASLSQRNGQNDTFGTPNCDNSAVDDMAELVCSLDLHSDAVLDGKYVLTPALFAGLALGGNQFHDQDGQMIVVGFVADDSPTAAMQATVGFWAGNPTGTPFPQTMVCVDNNALPLPDEDCNGDGTRGDDAFVGLLRANQLNDPGLPAEKRGPTTVNVTQGGIAISLPMVVVGEGFSLKLQTFETGVQAAALTKADCPLGGSTAAFTEALGRPDKTIMLAHVVDSDGTEITGVFLSITSSNPNRLFVASALSLTLDVGAFGKAGPDIFCGGTEAGPVTITVQTLTGAIPGVGVNPELSSRAAIATADYTVTGPPASMTLTATPASITCDGVASSEVAASVVDAAGNKVENGTAVNFSVQTLGTANPVNTKTDGGVAKSTIVPVSAGTSQGVPVIVTASGISNSILVSCTGVVAGAATAAAAGGGASGGNTGTITPPNTGTGGFLPGAQGHDAGFPALELALLTAAAGATYGVRRVLARRRSEL